MYTLHIANKNYSSWSLRPWVLLKELNIPFVEKLHPFNQEDFSAFSPTALVPCLYDSDTVMWESLGIVEYLAERHPQVWPQDSAARAWARCATAEMHAGLNAIRNDCSMTCGQRVTLHQQTDALKKDLLRLNTLWQEGLNQFGGPFLAGEQFTAVDAFFTPVAFRIQSYDLPMNADSQRYVDLLLSLPAMKTWYEQALQETWRDEPHEKFIQSMGEITEDLRASS